MFDKNLIIQESLKKIKNPVILEFGVNRGRSSQRFLNHILKSGGDIFSIDIKDCSHVISSEKWNFFQCDDSDCKKIINRFPKLSEGIDLLFIDSYHDPFHVKKLLERWFVYVKKDGYIYFDDTESGLYRIKKNVILSIVNDAISNVITDFYYSNYGDLIYNKYFNGSGLSEFIKLSEIGTKPKLEKIWSYNFIFAKIYLFLKLMKLKILKR